MDIKTARRKYTELNARFLREKARFERLKQQFVATKARTPKPEPKFLTIEELITGNPAQTERRADRAGDWALEMADFRVHDREPAPISTGGWVTRRSDRVKQLCQGVSVTATIPERIEYCNAALAMISALEEGTPDSWGADDEALRLLRAHVDYQREFVAWYQRTLDEIERRVDRDYHTLSSYNEETGVGRVKRGWEWFLEQQTERGASGAILRGMVATLVQTGWLTQDQVGDLDFAEPKSEALRELQAEDDQQWKRYLAAYDDVVGRVIAYATKRKRHPLPAGDARQEAHAAFVLNNCPKNETGITEWITKLRERDLLPSNLLLQIRQHAQDIFRGWQGPIIG